MKSSFGALLTLAASLLLAPSSAQAGCSHYVVSSNDTSGVMFDLDQVTLSNRASTLSPAHAPGRPDRRIPCSGAFCSGTPAFPAPSLPSISTSPSQWALPATSLQTDGPGSVILAREIERYDPIFSPDSIFHPPRSLEPRFLS